MNIVIASDSPTFDTGFGLQTRFLAGGLHQKGYTVETVSLPPLPPDFDPHQTGLPFPVHPKTGWEGVLEYDKTWTLITLTDDYKLLPALYSRPPMARWFRWVAYDGDVMPLAWIGLNALSVPVLASPWGKTMLHSRWPHLPVQIIPHGLDTAFWRVPSPAEKQAAVQRIFHHPVSFVMGYVGRGHPRKNIPLWFWVAGQLAKRHPEIQFLLRMPPQDGHDQYDWMEFVDRYQLWGRVQWVPGVSQEKGVDLEFLRDVYWACDVLVHPAMSEGFGLTPVESRLCGVPAIVGNYASMPDWASPEEIVPVAAWSWEAENIKQARVDGKAIVKKVEQWLAAGGTRSRIALKSRKQVEHLTIDAMVDQWEALLQSERVPPAGVPGPVVNIQELSWGGSR